MRLRKPKEFTIDRGKWAQGGDINDDILGDSELLNAKGNMCCLGFYSEACGVPRENLNTPTPDVLAKDTDGECRVPFMTKRHGKHRDFFDNTDFADDLMNLNDNYPHHEYGDVRKRDKERVMKERFSLIDVKVKFVGQYPKGVI